jgi:hypothetical protein
MSSRTDFPPSPSGDPSIARQRAKESRLPSVASRWACATVNSHRHGCRTRGGNVAREGTEGPGKPGSDRRRVSEAGEEGSQRHACGVRLRAHTRGAAFGRGPQASDCRDERRATRPYACQWPPRANRRPAGSTCRPELARFGPCKTGTTRRLTVAGACNAPGARKI